MNRREFICRTSVVTGAAAIRLPAVAGPFSDADLHQSIPLDKKLDPAWIKSLYQRGEPTVYRGAELEKIGMPVGGICAGQLYLGGDGRLWHWDIFNTAPARNYSDTSGPNYAKPPKPHFPLEQGVAIKITSAGKSTVRTLDARGFAPANITFRGQYPIGLVDYRDPELPVTVSLEAFSPFIPLNVEDSSLPSTILRYTVKNVSSDPVEVELGGWLENAVCPGVPMPESAQRRNSIVRKAGLVMIHATAERRPDATPRVARQGILFDSFEEGYGKWTSSGDAFGANPAAGTLPDQQRVSGFLGKRLVNTFLRGDATKGRLISPEFQVERRFISFLIGGGQSRQTGINLLVNGKVTRTASGRDSERLDWHDWDVTEFEGNSARIEIVDDATGPWGHINVDQIIFSDSPMSARVPLEQREDFGSLAFALLGDEKVASAIGGILTTLPEGGFSSTEYAAGDVTAPFGTPLIGSVSRKFTLAPGQEGEATFILAWFFPGLMRQRLGALNGVAKLRRFYSLKFESAAGVARYIEKNLARLAGETRLWNKVWYDSTLPLWFLDRTFAPVCTLATSTCYLFDTGRFYGFEGVYCCQGTCQHVWNYAQSVARLFPSLERDLRERTDFGTAWHENGAIDYRGEAGRHVAHDGQCGVILRAWREHQMCADDSYLRAKWPRIRKSVEYLIGLDRGEDGLLEGEQYNTLDAAWFGPMAWISSFYIAGLRAAEAMANDVGDVAFAQRCREIAERGSAALVSDLFNGEFFIHKPDPAHPKATNTNNGCHIDQLMGQAWALQVGLPRIVPLKESASALEAIWKYNFTPDVGPFRERSSIKGGRWYAIAGEGGVVMTTFPRGGAKQAVGQGGFGYYFNEVWTGQEHQLAAHMLWEGRTDYALAITRTLHDRHHAARRNPYNEVECSDHYTRAMSSHGTFLAACGYEYHGPRGHLGFAPRITPERFKAPFTAAEGWGTFEQTIEVQPERRQREIITVAHGRLRLQSLAFATSLPARSARVRVNGVDVVANAVITGARVIVKLDQPVTLNLNERIEVTLA
jgi:non-lysosomal glucosylceramidase